MNSKKKESVIKEALVLRACENFHYECKHSSGTYVLLSKGNDTLFKLVVIVENNAGTLQTRGFLGCDYRFDIFSNIKDKEQIDSLYKDLEKVKRDAELIKEFITIPNIVIKSVKQDDKESRKLIAYCPYCHTQVALTDGVCHHCHMHFGNSRYDNKIHDLYCWRGTKEKLIKQLAKLNGNYKTEKEEKQC